MKELWKRGIGRIPIIKSSLENKGKQWPPLLTSNGKTSTRNLGLFRVFQLALYCLSIEGPQWAVDVVAFACPTESRAHLKAQIDSQRRLAQADGEVMGCRD